MSKIPNLFEMYMENDCKFGFFVRRNSWGRGKYGKVVAIDGVKEGEAIEGKPPYFTRYYPIDHPKAGKVWKRFVHLSAPWFDDEIYATDCGGTYAWTRVYPDSDI